MHLFGSVLPVLINGESRILTDIRVADSIYFDRYFKLEKKIINVSRDPALKGGRLVATRHVYFYGECDLCIPLSDAICHLHFISKNRITATFEQI